MKGCSAKITVLYVAGEESLLKYPFLIQCLFGIYNVSGQSTLQPAIVHSCPNENLLWQTSNEYGVDNGAICS